MLIQEYDVPVSELLFKLTGVQLSLNNLVSVDLWRRLDSLLKEGRRLHLAKQLIHIAETYHIKMIVCGTGWDKLGDLPPSISFAGAVHYDQQFEFFRNSKILVNLDPNWVYGPHDRVFNAISVGGCVVTNVNEFISHSFIGNESISTYSNFHQLRDLILNRYNQKIAEQALPPYIEKHTWSTRVKLLLQHLQ